MNNLEKAHCRAPLARIVNNFPSASWIYNANMTFSNKVTGGGYESGRPDAFIFAKGKVACVECKAFQGNLYLGNPDDPSDTRGWSYAQRNWYNNVAIPTGTPYYLALWLFPHSGRIASSKASFYVVPADIYLTLEKQARPNRTVPSIPSRSTKANADIDLPNFFRSFQLDYVGGTYKWAIPKRHEIFTFLY